MEPYAVYYEALVLQERGKLAQDISRKSEIDRQALQENLMVNSVDCSINIEQGQKSDLIFVDSTLDVREEADEHGFRGVHGLYGIPTDTCKLAEGYDNG